MNQPTSYDRLVEVLDLGSRLQRRMLRAWLAVKGVEPIDFVEGFYGDLTETDFERFVNLLRRTTRKPV